MGHNRSGRQTRAHHLLNGRFEGISNLRRARSDAPYRDGMEGLSGISVPVFYSVFEAVDCRLRGGISARRASSR